MMAPMTRTSIRPKFTRVWVGSFYVTLLMLINEIGGIPIAFYAGFLLERRYGLSTERFSAWLRDQVKALAIGLVLACAAASILYAVIRWSPEWWWALAGLVFAAIIVGLTQVAPVWLLPLFYRLKPL